jgi:hypothetical protein
MMAGALANELALARRMLLFLVSNLDKQIPVAESTGNASSVCVCFKATSIDAPMCDRFIDKLGDFDKHAAPIIEAVNYVFEARSNTRSIVAILDSGPWSAVATLVNQRRTILVGQAESIKRGINALRASHHLKDNDAYWNALTN